MKLEKILLLLYCLLDPLINKYSMELYDKFADRLQELPKNSCCHQGEDLIITIPSQRKFFVEKDASSYFCSNPVHFYTFALF